MLHEPGDKKVGLSVKVEIVVCDVCQTPGREARGYTVTQGNRTAARDLCARHAAPLEALLEGGEARPARPATRPRSGRITVTSLDEIEARKTKA